MKRSRSYRISTSEVATYFTCRRRWYYAHHPGMKISPRTYGEALTRGIEGHATLEQFFKDIVSGLSIEQATNNSNMNIMTRTIELNGKGDINNARVVASLGVLLQNYYEEKVPGLLEKYEIIGVEEDYFAPLTTDIEFAGRVDLTLLVKDGPYKGHAVPYDHKFTYDFWEEIPTKMNPQISNYTWVLNQKGYNSSYGILNQIRYRENAIVPMDEVPVKVNETLRETLIADHLRAAREIVSLKELNKEDADRAVTRSASKFNCRYCIFNTLCFAEAEGKDVTNMLTANFIPNTYGYDAEIDVQ